jgi:hypothetical protein
MSELYILYDNDGKYVGSHYDIGPPGGYEGFASGYRKLSYQEIDSIHANYKMFIYNELTLRKLREIFLSVSTSIFEIDGVTKLSVSVKAAEDSEDTSDLIGTDIEVTINDQKVNIPFGNMILLNPDHPGTYVITLSDKRCYAKKSKYVVAVLDQIKEGQ